MTARQTIRSTLHKLKQQSRETGQLHLPAAAVTVWAEAGIFLLLAAVLAGAVILEGCAPFGVALVGAAGPGLRGGAALLGACFGAVASLGFSAGLRYCAAAILTFAVLFAFADWKPFHRPWVGPVLAGLLVGFTGVLVHRGNSWTWSEQVRLVLESALTLGAARCCRGVVLPKTGSAGPTAERRIGGLVLLAILVTALTPGDAGERFALGRCLSVLAVMLAAWQGGSAQGAAAGLVLGAAMDLAADGLPVYAAAYGLAGLAAGLRKGGRRWEAAAAFALAQGAALAWVREGLAHPGMVWELLGAAAVLFLLPGSALRRLGAWLAPAPAGPGDLSARMGMQRRLNAAAQAFRSLGGALRTAFSAPENDNDVATVFDRAAGRVCRGCALRDRCWQENYTATFSALNDATPAMVDRGRAEAGDFPGHFAQGCLHFPAFLAAVNEEYTALFYRRQYAARLRENRAAVCRQYDQLSDLLGDAAGELSRTLAPDAIGDRRVRERMAELGLDLRTAVFRDSRGLLRVEADGPGCQLLTRPSRLSDLSDLLGVPLRVEVETGEGVSLLQQEPLMAVAGVAAQKKSGETVSGDAGTYFKRADGKLYVLLCDGMGSGPEANRESTLAVRLLEQLLQAGIETGSALSTLASALALRGEETGGFTTVDLLQLDLFDGNCCLFKLGAAPTYIKRGKEVERLTGRALPAGLTPGSEPEPADRFPFRLAPGDCVLMVSDGVCGTAPDDWLRDKLARFDGESPKELAKALLVEGPVGATDDRTALAVQVRVRS